jgi:hypothetical protein
MMQWGKRACHQTWRQLDAAIDRRVISLGNRIDLPALEPPVGADVGIAREEGGQ